jgi:type III pantothenate kinase
MVPHRPSRKWAIRAGPRSRGLWPHAAGALEHGAAPGAARIIGAMLLTVDIGNTNITIGLVRDGALLATRRAAARQEATVDEIELLLDGLLGLDEAHLSEITAICLASVVPTLGQAVEEIAARRRVRILVASAGTVPIPIRTDRPAEVGADRLVNALAALRLYGAPAVVVDFGTATTFDVVSADGAYVGGAIAPGLELGLEALAERTAKLPRVVLRAPDRAIGRDTVSAIQSGAVLGHQALVAGLLARIRAELAATTGIAPRDVKAILTGGLSQASWIQGLEGIDAVDPDLTLRGLAILHAEVAGGEPIELGLG